MSTYWWRPLLWGIGGMAVGMIGVMLAVVLFTLVRVTDDIQDTGESSQETGRSSQELLEALEDCTEPGGECYRETEARDAAQVGAFNAVVIATNWCAELEPETYRELSRCVAKILEGKGHR
jgi:hypothetical protein